jgi:hypothetical protein
MQEIIDRYIAAWNETDAAARRELVGFLDKVPAAA